MPAVAGSRRRKRCYLCGELIEIGEEVTTRGYDYPSQVGHAHSDCYENRCRRCGNHLAQGGNDTFRYCASCSDLYLSRCAHCGTVNLTYLMNFINGERYCTECSSTQFLHCPECHTYSSNESDFIFDEFGVVRCYTCEERHSGILDYHEEEKNQRFFMCADETDKEIGYEFFGTEVETEFNTDYPLDTLKSTAKSFKKFYDNLEMFLEHDGSIVYGFEFVTAPMSFEYHKQNFEKYLTSFQYLKTNGYLSHDTETCGMHVHVDNRAFGLSGVERELTAAKCVVVFELFWNEILKFSRRTEHSINRWAARYCYEDDSTEEIIKKGESVSRSRGNYEGRYHCINFRNPDTVEFRVFQGTLNVDTYLATIEFVRAVVRSCRAMELKDVIGSASLRDFITKAGYMSEKLNEYFNKRGI